MSVRRATGADLHRRLTALEKTTPAIDPSETQPGRWSKRQADATRWVKPNMVVEVSFADWTPDQKVRHAVFQGIRTDKPPRDITKESAVDFGASKPARAAARGAKGAGAPLKISHGDRVIDTSTGLTKLDLVRYYESVADWILPHLTQRPVSLVRAPQGVGGQLFFQKHPESRMPGLKALDPGLWPGHTALLEVHGVDALLAAAQMNVVELHTWNSTTTAIDKPDRVIFDLDPGEGVSWSEVQEAAVLTRAMLEALGLKAWLKTSGGKGLHVVVPLARCLEFDAVKAFSQRVVRHMAKTIPQKFVVKSGGANRVGKIFIDYLRNGHAQTIAAAFSARVRPGLGVSMPVSWEQLAELKSGAQWTIATAREHLSFLKEDPWAEYWTTRQTLTAASKLLE